MRSKNFFNVLPVTTLSVFLLPLIGCNDEFEPINIIQREVIENGFTTNGFTTNGFTTNGFTTNGFTLNGTAVSGVKLDSLTVNGAAVTDLALRGSSFSGSSTGKTISGFDFSGALASVVSQPAGATQATQYTLRFDKIYVDPQTPQGDIYLYDVSYQRSGDTTWASLCASSNGNAAAAIPILNYWNLQTGERVDNPNVITFACISGALGKCVRLGYRPWAQVNSCNTNSCSSVSLVDHHQACTRLIKADYCGNGTSYTLEGTPIEVYDALSPQIQKQTMSWNIEAKWTPKGATCLGALRHAELVDRGRAPDCDGDGRPDQFPQCGANDGLRGSLLGSTYDSSSKN